METFSNCNWYAITRPETELPDCECNCLVCVIRNQHAGRTGDVRRLRVAFPGAMKSQVDFRDMIREICADVGPLACHVLLPELPGLFPFDATHHPSLATRRSEASRRARQCLEPSKRPLEPSKRPMESPALRIHHSAVQSLHGFPFPSHRGQQIEILAPHGAKPPESSSPVPLHSQQNRDECLEHFGTHAPSRKSSTPE